MRAFASTMLFWAILTSGAVASPMEDAVKNTQAAGYQSTLAARCGLLDYEAAEGVLTSLEMELRPFPFQVQDFFRRQYAMGQRAADSDLSFGRSQCAHTTPSQLELIRRMSSGEQPIIDQYIRPRELK